MKRSCKKCNEEYDAKSFRLASELCPACLSLKKNPYAGSEKGTAALWRKVVVYHVFLLFVSWFLACSDSLGIVDIYVATVLGYFLIRFIYAAFAGYPKLTRLQAGALLCLPIWGTFEYLFVFFIVRMMLGK